MRNTRSRNRQFTPEFRRDAVALCERSDRPMSHIAKSLGIQKTTLYTWYNQEMAKKGKRPAAAPPAILKPLDESLEEKIARLELENARLKKQNEELEEDKQILKKFAAFSVKEKM